MTRPHRAPELPPTETVRVGPAEARGHGRRSEPLPGVALWNLFTVLSTWWGNKPTEYGGDGGGGGGLELELNARSPSDTTHWVKDHCAGFDRVRTERRPGRGAARGDMKRYHDPKHGWLSGKQIDIDPHPYHLPVVPLITGLALRREFRRQLAPEALRLLSTKLPRLEKLVYEPWRVRWEPRGDRPLQKVPGLAGPERCPRASRSFATYEEFSEPLAGALRLYMGPVLDRRPPPTDAAGGGLCESEPRRPGGPGGGVPDRCRRVLQRVPAAAFFFVPISLAAPAVADAHDGAAPGSVAGRRGARHWRPVAS
ncbi:hypothetical protein PG988_001808 [Apiospora saccharicola]